MAWACLSSFHVGKNGCETWRTAFTNGRTLPRVPKPSTCPPPTGQFDARLVISDDRDHWVPAFLPPLRQGLPLAAVTRALTDFVRIDGQQNPAQAKFKPTTSSLQAGIRFLTVRLVRDDAWRGLGLRSLTLEMKPQRVAGRVYYQYFANVAERCFGDRDPQPLSDPMEWRGDHGASVVLRTEPLRLVFDLPNYWNPYPVELFRA